MTLHEDAILAVIGLGYVGLPLAVEFGKKRPVIGFDIKSARIEALRAGRDSTLEVETEELATARKLMFTNSVEVPVGRTATSRATTDCMAEPWGSR